MDISAFRTPGQLIAKLLEERGWTQRVLAVVLGIEETGLFKLVAGKRTLDAKMALSLSAVFGVPAEAFLGLQKSYDLAQAMIVSVPDPGLADRARLFGELPIAEMIKRGWIVADGVRDVETVESELARFFEVASPDEIEILPHAAKRTNVSEPTTPAQLAWLYRVKRVAELLPPPRYTQKRGQSAVKRLSALLLSAEEIRHVPNILMEAGIRLVIVESLPGSEIDGVSFWIGNAPVIGLSLRFDRIDNFWFVLRHELEHTLRGHGKSAAMLDTNLEGERAGQGPSIPEEERQANAAAADFCVPQKKLDSLITRKSPLFSERDFLGFVKTVRIHPGIVAGQLQHKTERYDLFRKHIVKIRHIIVPVALTDGWGSVAPIGILGG